MTLAVFTIISAGIFSFASLFMLLLSAALFLRSDLNYSRFELMNNKLIFTKGFLLFKNRHRTVISAPQIIRSDFFSNENNAEEVNLFFFSEDGKLFEEAAFVTAEKTNVFKSELREAYVFVK